MDDGIWNIFGMILSGETEVYRKVPVTEATLFTIHPTWKGLGSKEDRRTKNPAV